MSKVRSITPNDPADFTPELGNYKTLQPFRYWCQKVLPLVYDDSLSYYELLCKVVDYLNKAMEDVETLHGDVTNLHTAYEELQSYVNNYFSTLDVQEEINNKLDTMSTDGTLETLIKNIIGDSGSPIVVDSITEMTNTTRLYILKESGELYYYNGSNFVTSGITYTGVSNTIIGKSIFTAPGTAPLDDMDTLPMNSIYVIDSVNKMAHSPIDTYAIANVLTYNYNSSIGGAVQIVTTVNRCYIRFCFGSPTVVWRNWFSTSHIYGESIFTAPGTAPLDDMDTLPMNSIYVIDSVNKMAHSPIDTYAIANVLTYNYNSSIGGAVQIVTTVNRCYIRFCFGSPTAIWRNWFELSDRQENLFGMFNNFCVIGDSYSSGAVNTKGHTTNTKWFYWGDIIARMYGSNCTTYAFSGATTSTWIDTYFNDLVTSELIKCYIFNLGINDVTKTTLGTINDIKTDYNDNPDTFYGNVDKILRKISELNPQAYIILFTPLIFTNASVPYKQAIHDIGDKYGYPIVDTLEQDFNSSPFTPLYSGHTTGRGYYYMAYKFNKYLNDILLNNTAYFGDYNGYITN